MNVDKCWYVLRAVFRKELAVRDGLRRAGLHCYVPMKYQVEIEKGHKTRRLVPAISELVFVYATSDAINDYKLHCKETVYWLTKSKGNKHEKIVVPDKSMEDFIRITQQTERSVTFFRPEELNLSKGDHVIIHGGSFDGLEGILMKVKGKRERQLVVSIPSIADVSVSLQPEMVELITRNVAKSHDRSRDSKELIRLATQMLTTPPSRIESENEWNLLYNETHRLYESLTGLKGYLPSLEGQIALALLLAERALGMVSNITVQRCCNAASHLRPSKLRNRLLEELETYKKTL